jgi:hypothetical protein
VFLKSLSSCYEKFNFVIMIPEKIAFILVLAFFLIVFIQSGADKVFDYKGNLSFLNDLLGILCLIGIVDAIFNASYFIGQLGLIIGSVALLVLLFGQRVSKNYDGAKTIAIYFILAMMGIVLA